MAELIFTKVGKYRNGNKITVITEKEVKNKTVINVDGNNSDSFVKAGKAEYVNTNKVEVVKRARAKNNETDNS